MKEISIEITKELLEAKNWRSLWYELAESDPLSIASAIEKLDIEEGTVIFRLLQRENAKETFQHLTPEKQEEIIERLATNPYRAARLLNDLNPDDRTAFFEELPEKITRQLIQLLSPAERLIAVKLLGYPEGSIGRLMTPEFVALKPHYTVEQALAHIRKHGHSFETINTLYIVDKSWRLLDDIRIGEIILAQPDQYISDLIDYHCTSLNAYDDQEDAVRIFQEQDRDALPVVDNDGMLLGIVTFDDIMDVAEEENTEDFQKFGSFQAAILNPIKAGVFSLYQKRIGWLIALVFMNVFSGAALASFESLIQSAVALVFFLPLLIDSGGNAGSQSATLMIRSLAVGDVVAKDWLKLIGKEVLVSLLLGITMAIGVSIIAHFRAPGHVLIVASTMVLIVLTGSLIGMLLPFIFTKLKLDPAAASAPLITSIADILGVVIYFSIASWYLGF